jgi:hypothetical protein
VLLDAFSCGCGKPRQYHFPCSHYVVAARHRNFAFESRIPYEFSVESLVRTWSPRFEPFLDESQWPTYTGPVYVADQRINGTNVVVGKGAGATWLWIRFPVEVGEVERPPFSWTQSRMNAEMRETWPQLTYMHLDT